MRNFLIIISCYLLNLLNDKYRDIRNALEHGRKDLIVDIIISTLRNKELELKSKLKDSKLGERLNIKENLNQSEKNNMCNFNSYKKV